MRIVSLLPAATEIVAHLGMLDVIGQVTCRLANRPRVAFLEWVDPLFCAGHWIPEMIELAGGREVIGIAGTKSRTMSPDELSAADPDIIVVCCCGWPRDRTTDAVNALGARDWWKNLRAVGEANVHVVDAASTFTTPGPGLVTACRLLADVFSESGPTETRRT